MTDDTTQNALSAALVGGTAPRRKAAAKNAPAAETVSEAVEATETVEAAANDTGEDAAPPRKGWWQRTFGD